MRARVCHHDLVQSAAENLTLQPPVKLLALLFGRRKVEASVLRKMLGRVAAGAAQTVDRLGDEADDHEEG